MLDTVHWGAVGVRVRYCTLGAVGDKIMYTGGCGGTC